MEGFKQIVKSKTELEQTISNLKSRHKLEEFFQKELYNTGELDIESPKQFPCFLVGHENWKNQISEICYVYMEDFGIKNGK